MQDHEHEPSQEGRSPITLNSDLLARLEMFVQAFDMSVASLGEDTHSGLSMEGLVDAAVQSFLDAAIDEYGRVLPD